MRTNFSQDRGTISLLCDDSHKVTEGETENS